MKVLQIYKTFLPDTVGGGEQVIKNICYQTQKLGVEQTVLTLADEAREEMYGSIPVIRYHKNFEYASCPFSLKLFFDFKKLIKAYDILHYYYPWPYADLLHLLHFVDKPTVITYLSDVVKERWQKRLYNPLSRAFLKKANMIVVPTLNLLNSSDDLQPFRSKAEIIPFGIAPEDYILQDSSLVSAWQQKIGRDFILFIGSLRHYKGLMVLLEAIKLSPVPLVIMGEGAVEMEAKAYVTKHHLTSVQFIGELDDQNKMAVLQLCRAVVLPSHLRSEAFGISLLEGALFKKALISTELGTGTSFVNQHDKTGFVVPPNDAAGLSKAMCTLVDNPQLAEQFGQNAYTWFQENFLADKMGAAYYALYQKLLEK